MRFVSKSNEYQVYGELLPDDMTNQQMRNSPAYKTYLAFATGAATPKKARKFKKPASPSKKKDLIAIEEPIEKPIKKPAAKRQFTGVQIRDTSGVSVSKKNAPAKAERSKGIELLSEVTSLKEAQLKKVLNVSKVDSSKREYESWGDSDDDEDQQSHDESTKSDDKKEMYDDVNVKLKDIELEGEGKDYEEMTDAAYVDAKPKNVNQEVSSDEVKDVAWTTVTAGLTTQKTVVPLQSSSISSDYATKFLNFDSIPSADTEIMSMMDIKVQRKDLSIQTSPLITVPVTVIPKTSSSPATTIPPPILPFISLQQQSTSIPSPTTTEATTSTITAANSTTLTAIHQRLFDVKNEVKTLRNFDHSLAIHATVKSEVSIIVKEYFRTSLDDALHKVLQRHTAELVKEHFVPADATDALQQQTKPQKSHKAIYHAFMESILEDENAVDKGVADKLKKKKPDNTDKDEGPPVGPDQGLKRKKIDKETEPSKKAKSIRTSKGTTKSQPKATGKSAQAEEIKRLSDLTKEETSSKTFDDLMSTLIDFGIFILNRLQISDLTQNIMNKPEGNRYPFELSKPLPLVKLGNRQIVTVDYFFNNDLAYFQGGSTYRTYTASLTKTKAAKYDLPGIEDMVPNLWSRIKVTYDKHALLGEDIVHLAAALCMFTRRIVIQKKVEDLQLGVESYQKKLNISKPRTCEEDLSRRAPYTTLSYPQGVIYEDKLNRKRLMRSDELYKFSDGTLQSVQDTLHDMATNLRMGYNKAM
nr:hypothetical protein [Tanacetum cinerariifolium]